MAFNIDQQVLDLGVTIRGVELTGVDNSAIQQP